MHKRPPHQAYSHCPPHVHYLMALSLNTIAHTPVIRPLSLNKNMSIKLQRNQRVTSSHCKSTLNGLEVVRPATTTLHQTKRPTITRNSQHNLEHNEQCTTILHTLPSPHATKCSSLAPLERVYPLRRLDATGQISKCPNHANPRHPATPT